jgi:hypothetical protein
MRTWAGQAFASANPVRVGPRFPLIPAQAGIQSRALGTYHLGPRFRGDERMLHGSTQPDRL